ncbi:MAG TPA: zf-HC2 domain-containing protein [Verrucomicrobiae bacterium]|nr:zf-HC2 domain-containing protein [Verrucomicrobiae bacterium]
MSSSDDPLARHFDEVTGLLYLEGQLDEEHTREVSAHLSVCAPCKQLLHALEKESVWLRESLQAEDEAIPARLIAPPQRGAAHWGWMIAFGLCAAGLYTVWNGFVEPSYERASQAGFSQGNVLTMLFFTGAFWKGWDQMRSVTELLAVATLGGVAIWLLRKQWRRFTAIAFVMGALVCALTLAPVVRAADVQRGAPSYTLPAGQEVKTDLIVIADRARIDGDVDGDLIVFSEYITVSGHVKGDIIGFGQELRVNGPVDGNVRVLCQTLSLNSTVGKNVMGWAGVAEMTEKATVGGTMTEIVGAAELDGKLGGDLLIFAGNLEMNGSIGGNAKIRADQLRIGPDGEIKGETKFEGRHQPVVESGAKLGSPIQVTIPKTGPDYSRVTYYWHRVLLWGASFLFGLLVLLLAPGFFVDAESAAKRIGPAIGFGVLFFIATPIAVVIACFTIVGLSVGIATLLFYAIAIYAAKVFVAAWIGEKLLGPSSGVGPAIGRLALGLAIIRALLIVPYAGFWIGFLVIAWGMGAIVLALYRRMGPQLAHAT